MTTTALAERTPPDIDGEIAELWGERGQHERRLMSYIDTIHHLARDRRERGRTRRWGKSHDEAIEIARSNVAPWEAASRDRALDGIASARGDIERLSKRINVLEDEHLRRGWNRFFLVPGGHIHASMNCSTCFPTTQFGWLPALSGLSEAAAVAAEGTILCSVCFPSAPVEWRAGPSKEPDPDQCSGAGKYLKPANGADAYRPYAVCPDCGQAVSLTKLWKLRKHKVPKEQRR